MKGALRQSMDWLHTWTGVVFGAALFMVFLGGTAAVFKEETTAWMTPEVSRPADPAVALAMAEARLKQVASDGTNWSISLPDERNPATRIAWRAKDARTFDGDAILNRETLDANGSPRAVRDTRGGDLFYRLHYRFEIKGRKGWWLSGAAGVLMLVLITTGVITHKRIFKDFFTFRPRAHVQRSWMDAHVMLAVLLLPFHVMITYTGLVPIMTTVMPWSTIASYGDSRPALIQAMEPRVVRQASQASRQDPTKAKAKLAEGPYLPLQTYIDRANSEWGGRHHAARISLTDPNSPKAKVDVGADAEGSLSNRGERLTFNAADATLIGGQKPQRPVPAFQSVLYGLHMARFSEIGLRWTYFMAGLGSTAMIGGGMILWSIKRRPKTAGQRPAFGHRLVERVNIAAIVGLPIAMAGLFWANRLLPVDITQRPEAETRAFFTVWIVMALTAALRPLKRAWVEHLSVAALVFGLLPVLNALTTRRNLVVSIWTGDWLMAGFDLFFLAAGVGFGLVAFKLSKPTIVIQRSARLATEAA